MIATLTRLNTFTDCIVSRASPVSFEAPVKRGRNQGIFTSYCPSDEFSLVNLIFKDAL